MKQLHHIKLFLVFLVIFVQLFTPIAQATDTIVDDAPPVDENKP